MNDDKRTAEAFAHSWNHLPPGSIYTREQFEEWLDPIELKELEGKSILELGCGNASLLVHLVPYGPQQITGVDLGSSVEAARRNMRNTGLQNYSIIQTDLTTFRGIGFDLVYCIGVLHHLLDANKGFESVIANVKPGGRFHCWVYAREGNTAIIRLVDPIRKITSRLPWWLTKFVIVPPLVLPYFIYAKLLHRWRNLRWLRHAPLYGYSMWIAQRSYPFFHHVAFDQLVSPRTHYIDKSTVESWLNNSRVNPGSSYLIFRNGNSWKFGGAVR